jgi:hypothetical protein
MLQYGPRVRAELHYGCENLVSHGKRPRRPCDEMVEP